jgi:hypothetical protein
MPQGCAALVKWLKSRKADRRALHDGYDAVGYQLSSEKTGLIND